VEFSLGSFSGILSRLCEESYLTISNTMKKQEVVQETRNKVDKMRIESAKSTIVLDDSINI
jgi:hypothetical protein